MGYICLKTTFLHLKHLQIYLTLLSTTCVKIHQIPYAIFETVSHFFTTQLVYITLAQMLHTSEKNYPIKLQNFRFFTAQVKIHQISHVIFQTSDFFFKIWITVQCHER